MEGVLHRFQAVHNKIASIPSAMWLFCSFALQAITCSTLVIISGANVVDMATSDSPWYYAIQIPLTLSIAIAVRRLADEKRRARAVLVYVAFTFFLAMVAAVEFVLFANDREITTRKCRNSVTRFNFTLTESECSTLQDDQATKIGRTAAYLVIQCICIHPSISYVMDVWSNDVTALNSHTAKLR
eukprot:Opistho-2@82983